MLKEKEGRVSFLSIALLVFAYLPAASAGRLGTVHDGGYAVFVIPPITSNKILPDRPGILDPRGEQIEITAAPGEYEPASFVVKSKRQIRAMSVAATDLTQDGEVIRAAEIDIRVVKCWYQSGTKVYETSRRLLVPELLLKDDNLVKVDHENRHNYLRQADASSGNPYVLISGPENVDISSITPRDAVLLQPVDVEPNTNKQFWVTVRIPEGTRPGRYEGKLLLTPDNAPAKAVPVVVHVLPFVLEKPALRYAIYYRGRLGKYPPGDSRYGNHPSNRGVMNSNWKTAEQYLAEMKNLKAHGVEYPTVYQGDEKLFHRETELREIAELPRDSLYSLGAQTGNASSTEGITSLVRKVKRWVKVADEHGYGEMFFYGIDEAKDELLESQRVAWSAVRLAGGKVFAAIHPGGAAKMGEFVDTAVVPGPLDQDEAERYHVIGRKAFSYSNPQVGEENPEIYRRNYGVRLWKAGYDGSMNYAYQHSANHIWNDFDDKKYRDHVFAYPTVDGVIDTIQFEGFREGIDDVRYLTTLTAAIRTARNTREAEKARRWLDAIDPDRDPQVLRQEAIRWIMKLRNVAFEE